MVISMTTHHPNHHPNDKIGNEWERGKAGILPEYRGRNGMDNRRKCPSEEAFRDRGCQEE